MKVKSGKKGSKEMWVRLKRRIRVEESGVWLWGR